MQLRKGREFYNQHYSRVIELYNSGLSASQIAKQLGISYSCVYHWTRGLRKPASGALVKFQTFLEKGPSPVMEIKKHFPKHNELFLTARRRGLPVKRKILPRKFGQYALWYYIEAQENELKKQLAELVKKYKEVREKVFRAFEKSAQQKNRDSNAG
jgi:hypothetical protein